MTLTELFKETIDIVKKGKYEVGNLQILFPQNEVQRMIEGTIFYETSFNVNDIQKKDSDTLIKVINEDSLIAAKQLQDKGLNVATLNMANGWEPGGGVRIGARAQEENLFRRSNLFQSLYQFAPYAEEYGLTKSPHQYPMDRNYGGIYTPNAIVFRGTESEGYPLLERPYYMSFISVAAINDPNLDQKGMIISEEREIFKNKMRTLFRIGLKNRHDALVLGAWGCGAFNCPPKQVASIFHEVLNEVEFKNKYKIITFAIIENRRSLSNNRTGNLKPFVEEFS